MSGARGSARPAPNNSRAALGAREWRARAPQQGSGLRAIDARAAPERRLSGAWACWSDDQKWNVQTQTRGLLRHCRRRRRRSLRCRQRSRRCRRQRLQRRRRSRRHRRGRTPRRQRSSRRRWRTSSLRPLRGGRRTERGTERCGDQIRLRARARASVPWGAAHLRLLASSKGRPLGARARKLRCLWKQFDCAKPTLCGRVRVRVLVRMHVLRIGLPPRHASSPMRLSQTGR